MFFHNLQIYRLPSPWAETAEQLEEQLARKRFVPCGNQDQETLGWLSPTGDNVLVHRVGGQWLIALGVEQKLLPTSVVKQEAEVRAEAMAEQQGYKPGRKQMKDLRELVMQELLPRAFVRRSKVFAWIDPVGGWLCVDASSRPRAEDVLELLRQTLDALPLSMLRTELSPTTGMRMWLESPASLGSGFTIDQDCELRSVTEDHSAVRYTRHPLEGDEVRGHLTAGKLPTSLALTFDDRVSFVLTEQLAIKRLDFLDVVKEKLDQHGAEDARALFDAGFALMTGELGRLLGALVEALGGELAAAQGAGD